MHDIVVSCHASVAEQANRIGFLSRVANARETQMLQTTLPS